MSLTGVTGARAELAADLESRVRARPRGLPASRSASASASRRPSRPRAIGRYADGVVVGSALVDRIERAATPDEAVDSVARFVAALKAPLRKGTGCN